MIDVRKSTHPLADFKRRTSSYLIRMKRTGKPVVLTVNGRAAVVVQDAESYQRLLDAAAEADLASVRRGIEQANRGEGRPMRQALREIAAKKGIRLGR